MCTRSRDSQALRTVYLRYAGRHERRIGQKPARITLTRLLGSPC